MKMYAIFSEESLLRMKGVRGKIAAQAGHAYLHAWWNAEEKYANSNAQLYRVSKSATKICCVVDTDEELEDLYRHYRSICGTTRVVDNALTVLDKPGLTCIGIGPIRQDQIEANLASIRTFT